MSQSNEKPSQAEFGLTRAFLAQQGFSQQWIQQHVNSGMTRGEAADALKAAMRELPKAHNGT